MYDIFKDLLKLADEMMDVIHCQLSKDGSIEIVGEDGKGERVTLSFGRAEDAE